MQKLGGRNTIGIKNVVLINRYTELKPTKHPLNKPIYLLIFHNGR